MKIAVFNQNPMGTNTYVIQSENKSAAMIDPTGDAKILFEYLENQQLDVKYIILTHGHADHIGLVTECREATGAPLLVHTLDEKMINNKSLNLSPMFHNPMEFTSDIQLEDNQELTLGNLVLKIIHTPGHTPGCICIQVEDSLFTGDTLFKGSIGRTDLPGGDMDIMQDTLQKMITLNPELKIYPGHGESSVLKHEIATNPYLK